MSAYLYAGSQASNSDIDINLWAQNPTINTIAHSLNYLDSTHIFLPIFPSHTP